MAWLPRTEVANILDHLQRALHLHQAVEWCAALGQCTPARREQHLGGCGSVTVYSNIRQSTVLGVSEHTMIIKMLLNRTASVVLKVGLLSPKQGGQLGHRRSMFYLTTCKDDRGA